MSKTKIAVCIHWRPPEALKRYLDEHKDLYVPIFGGGKQKMLEMQDDWLNQNAVPDDLCADNISQLNQQLNELTTTYLIWKNLNLLPADTQNIGQNHYRRYFTEEQLSDLDKYDGIIATMQSTATAGFPCSIERQYSICHYAEDFELLEKLVKTAFPADAKYWDEWKQTCGLFAPCNMFVHKREVYNIFCRDLFMIALQLPKLIDTTGRDDYQKRACSFLCERFTSWWHYKEKAAGRMRWKEVPCVFKQEWKCATSGDNRGCYGGIYVEDKSMPKLKAFVEEQLEAIVLGQ